jgi:alkylhydroperoxidase family enzyme
MPRLPTVPPDQIKDAERIFGPMVAHFGYITNACLLMAHVPEIMSAYVALSNAVLRVPRKIPTNLKWMVAHVASRSAGCMYCTTHTIQNATTLRDAPMEERKIAAIWDFEVSPLFTDAERAALRVAQAGAVTPNCVSDELFDDLKKYYDTVEIIEIVSVIALFGFLNRWNDTMATPLEDGPLKFAAKHDLKQHGWTAGKHGPEAA